jgi:hypothetical protein
VRTFSTASRARSARRGPSGPSPRARKRNPNPGALTAAGPGGAGAMRPAGIRGHQAGSPALAPCGARRAATPGATPRTVRHRLAAATPAGRAPAQDNGHPPRRCGLEPVKITVRSGITSLNRQRPPAGTLPRTPALPQRWGDRHGEVIPSPGQAEPYPGTPGPSRARCARPCGQTLASPENPG